MSAVLLNSDDNAMAKKKQKRKRKKIKARTRNGKCSHPDDAGAILRLYVSGVERCNCRRNMGTLMRKTETE